MTERKECIRVLNVQKCYADAFHHAAKLGRRLPSPAECKDHHKMSGELRSLKDPDAQKAFLALFGVDEPRGLVVGIRTLADTPHVIDIAPDGTLRDVHAAERDRESLWTNQLLVTPGRGKAFPDVGVLVDERLNWAINSDVLGETKGRSDVGVFFEIRRFEETGRLIKVLPMPGSIKVRAMVDIEETLGTENSEDTSPHSIISAIVFDQWIGRAEIRHVENSLGVAVELLEPATVDLNALRKNALDDFGEILNYVNPIRMQALARLLEREVVRDGISTDILHSARGELGQLKLHMNAVILLDIGRFVECLGSDDRVGK